MMRRSKAEVDRYVSSLQASAPSPREVRAGWGRKGAFLSFFLISLTLLTPPPTPALNGIFLLSPRQKSTEVYSGWCLVASHRALCSGSPQVRTRAHAQAPAASLQSLGGGEALGQVTAVARPFPEPLLSFGSQRLPSGWASSYCSCSSPITGSF